MNSIDFMFWIINPILWGVLAYRIIKVEKQIKEQK